MTDCQGDSLHASRAKTPQCRKHVSSVAIPRQWSVESSRLRLSIIMTRNLVRIGQRSGLQLPRQHPNSAYKHTFHAPHSRQVSTSALARRGFVKEVAVGAYIIEANASSSPFTPTSLSSRVYGACQRHLWMIPFAQLWFCMPTAQSATRMSYSLLAFDRCRGLRAGT